MSKLSEGTKNIKSDKTIERVNKNAMIKEIQKSTNDQILLIKNNKKYMISKIRRTNKKIAQAQKNSASFSKNNKAIFSTYTFKSEDERKIYKKDITLNILILD